MLNFNKSRFKGYYGTFFVSKIIFGSVILLFLNIVISNAQIVKCGDQSYKIKAFKNDSTYTFENQFVKSGRIENIKKSKMPLEIRIYMIDGYNPKVANIIFLKGDGKSIQGTLLSIMVVDRRRARPEDMISKDGLHGIIDLNKNKNYIFDCSVVDSIINHGLFTLNSSTDKEFKRNDNGIMDAQVKYIYEIKIGNHFRNFSYVADANLDDQVPGRFQEITSFNKYLLGKLKK